MSDRDDLLAIDAGNTRIKWAVHDGHAWTATGAIATSQSASLHESLRDALPVNRAIASNVAGAQVREHIEDACRRAGVPLVIIASQRAQLGVSNA